MHFEFATATQIVFGCGAIKRLGPIAAQWGPRALVVTGSDPSRAAPVIDALLAHGIECVSLPIQGEPTTDQARQGAQRARKKRCSLVVAVGGGAALDAGKAIAALATNPGDPLEYLEVIGRGQPLMVDPLPVVAVPTTAGTGSEVTRNAVLTSPGHGVKASMRSPRMLPNLAVVDPELTLSMPRAVTAATGMDALTQLVEAYVSQRSNPMTDAFCREGIVRAARSLKAACDDGADVAARTDMCLASLMGGLALANAGLGAVHGLAAVIGGLFGAGHGALCARMLGAVSDANLQALRARAPEDTATARYDEVARLITGDRDATALDAVMWMDATCEALRIPRLASYGVGDEHVADIVARAKSASSMRANPIALTEAELSSVLARCL
jgi:alcohol dehydrogenase class IV